MFEDFNVFSFLIAFFGLFIVIVIVTLIFAAYMARQKKHTPDNQEIVREKETIREIVMVPCKYCGSLIPSTALTCSCCGAGRKV
jgi:predicted cation transporter